MNLKWRNFSFISYSEELLQLQCDTVPIARNLESCRSKRDRRAFVVESVKLTDQRCMLTAQRVSSPVQRMVSVAPLIMSVAQDKV